jgi:hypothetical protein
LPTDSVYRPSGTKQKVIRRLSPKRERMESLA